MTGTIAKLEPKDVVELQAFLKICWVDTYSRILPNYVINTVIQEWQSRNALLREIDNPQVLFVGYREGGELLGIIRASSMDGSVMVVHQLYVLPWHQGRGIGRELMHHAMAHFGECKTMVLEVAKGNQKGISFYRRFGFRFERESVIRVGNYEIRNLVGEMPLE